MSLKKLEANKDTIMEFNMISSCPWESALLSHDQCSVACEDGESPRQQRRKAVDQESWLTERIHQRELMAMKWRLLFFRKWLKI